MKYFKDNSGNVFAYDDTQMDLVGSKIELTSEELEAHINPPKTLEQLKAELTSAIETLLDTKAKELRYDNMVSARSYVGFTNPFQVEALALAVWGANCWTKAGELEALGILFTIEEVLAEMPIYQGGI